MHCILGENVYTGVVLGSKISTLPIRYVCVVHLCSMIELFVLHNMFIQNVNLGCAERLVRAQYLIEIGMIFEF